MSDTQNRRIRALNLLYDRVAENAGEIPHFVDLLDEPLDEHTEDLWRGTLRHLRDRGLISLAETMGFEGTAAYLTDDGRAEVEAMRTRRQNPAALRLAAMNALAHWLHEQDPHGSIYSQIRGITSTRYAVFEGDPLPESLFRVAANRLAQLGLVDPGTSVPEIPEGPLTAKLSAEGQELVESGQTVEEFMQDQRRPQATNVTHFHGPVSGNVSWASAHVTQTATTTSEGIASDELIALLRAITQALPVLNLDDDQAAEVANSTRVVEAELARPAPSQQVVEPMMARIVDAIVSGGDSPLAVFLAAATRELMNAVGLGH